MRTPVYATQFKRDSGRCQKRGLALQKLIAGMRDSENGTPPTPQSKIRKKNRATKKNHCFPAETEI
jgi:hypothetical protein